MSCSETAALLLDMEEARRYVCYARMLFGFMMRQGRYNVDRRRCAPKLAINCTCAEDWGIAPRLAVRLIGRGATA